jgi:hypothetical protein
MGSVERSRCLQATFARIHPHAIAMRADHAVGTETSTAACDPRFEIASAIPTRSIQLFDCFLPCSSLVVEPKTNRNSKWTDDEDKFKPIREARKARKYTKHYQAKGY